MAQPADRPGGSTEVSTPERATTGSTVVGPRPVAGTRTPTTSSQPDWTVQAADTVERVVASIRNKTSLPLTTIARAIVFGLLVAVMGVAALVLVIIALVRAVDSLTGDGNVWIAYLSIGGIFSVAGAFLLRKATAARKE